MKRMTQALLCAAVAFGTLASQAQAKIVDIKAIAGKTPAEVAKVLGKPSKIEKAKPSGTGCNPCDKAFYKGEKFEVLFIKGRADWITINGVTAPYNANAIKELGLPASKPSTSNSDVIKWSPAGFQGISLFGYDGKSDYFYIKVKTR